MARFPCFLLFVVLIVLAASAAQSVASSLVHSFANTTSISSGAITSSPLQNTSSLSINTSCSSCVIAVDAGGLQQIFWFSHTWSVTLDTEYVTVTSFNGSNATAVTNTRTVLGDVQSLNTSDVPYIASLMSTLDNNVMYFNPNATLVRGTNGSVGTTSFPYGQAYAQVTAVGYRYMVPNTYCPMNMGIIAFDTKTCHCLMNTWFYVGLPVGGVSTSIYTLNRTYYEPLPSSQINEHNAGGADDINMLEPWDGQRFRTWLAEDEAFKSAFPNWEDCAFLNTAAGPPAAKLPVAALTATVSTTVQIAVASTSPPPKPAAQPPPPIPKPTVPAISTPAPVPTAQPEVGQSGSGSGGDQGGSRNGGSENIGPHGGSDSSRQSGNAASQGLQGAGESSGSSDNTAPTGSGGDTGLQGSGSGATGNGDHGSQGGGGSPGGDNGQGAQGGGETGGSSLSGPSGTTSDGGISGSNTPFPTVPFVITAGGQTVSGTIHGSTAAVVAGTTLFAGGPPSSAGGALISIHPGASSIAVNGESQLLPTAKPAPAAANPPAPIATVGSHTITASPGASEVYYAGTTLSQNGPRVTIDNTEIYVGSSGLVIGGSSTVAIPPGPNSGSGSESVPNAMTFTAAGHTLTSYPSGIAVAGTTIQSGSYAVISGTTISYGSSGLAIGTSTILLPTPPPSSASIQLSSGTVPTNIFTLGGQTFTANPTGIYIAGTTLTAGGSAITISGTAISLGSSGLVIASSTYAIPSGAFPSSTTVIGSETFTIHPTAIEVGGTTLTSGSPAITVHGTPMSFGSSGLVMASSTYAIPSGTSPLSTTVIGSQTFTIHPTAIEVAGTTLTPGGSAITISGTAISLGSSGLVIASSTYANPLPSSTTVIGSETFTIRPTAIEVGGTTLTSGGPAITIHGTPMSLGPSGLVVAGSTIPVRSSSTTSEGLGGVILAGFGPTSTGSEMSTSSTVDAAAFQGGATRLGGWGGGTGLGLLLVGGWMVF